MIAYFAKHPTAANVIMFAILILGILALPQLQKDTFPVTPTKNVEIKIGYSGASAQEVAQEICEPLEEALDGLSGINELQCDARENVAIANAEMASGENIDRFTSDIQQQVNSITTFPDRVEDISVTKMDRTANVASIAITGNMSAQDLYAYAQQVKQRFKAHPMIAQVTVQGFSSQEIEIRVSDWLLKQYNISIADLGRLVEQQSISLPAGLLSNQLEQANVRFNQKNTTEQQFKDSIIKSSTLGTQLQLGDIAEIQQKFTLAEDKILFNGERAALLEISKNYNQDSLKVRDAIQSMLVKEQKIAPEGLHLTVTQDVSVNITERLRILVNNGLQGLVLVFLVMWAFFNIRFSFWVAMGLPVSFLGSIFAMHLLGYTINMMTMVGLIVAIGLLMDDSLVIAENIAAKRQVGLSAVDASIEGTKEVLPGVISSFATTMIIIVPLMFLSGKMGDVLRYIPIILLITLLVSLIEAFFILPSHLSHSNLEVTPNKIRTWFVSLFEKLRDKVIVPLSSKAMKSPYLSLGTLFMVVLISTATIPAGLLKFKAMPSLESDTLQARIFLPQGSLLTQTDDAIKKVTDALFEINDAYQKQFPDSDPLVNSYSVLYNVNVDAQESGPHLATVSADLLPAQYRQVSIKKLIQDWKKKVGSVADVIALNFTDKERGLAGNAIDIRIQGDSLVTLKNVSWELQKWFKKYDGIFNLSDDLHYGRNEFNIRLKDNAGVMGVSATQVASTLRGALKGSTSLSIQHKGESVDIAVRVDKFTQDAGLQDLQDLAVTASNGQLVPLSSIAEFEQTRAFSRIQRVNGVNTITVTGNIDVNVVNAREIMIAFNKDFVVKAQSKYPQVSFISQGQDKESAETGTSLVQFFAVGIVGIYLILTFLFKSYSLPIAVMLAIPMGWIGVVWGHLFLGLDLTIPSLVGFATLAGVVVNDNILLVNFIKENVDKGTDLLEACKRAVHDRFRAIFITSLTTLAGLLPLLSESSTQAQFLIPLVASIAFGLIATTLLASIVVPSVIMILDDLGIFHSPSRFDGS
ncbi:efflux RND transporter permease subunit [Psychromonas algicola]|uniref:efflux RND transporter permease subunit n=1 Tax=Psychromonas algicola TaxID=2555642 RepID=UPI0010688C63|nr:efflux RND transporter permease subunit [Psychromonas sp. RZ5]TEW44089.1 efflux RND transporter permease subunit [Psychromonas sp. RZ5]